ncbi:MAG: response regulator [Thermanaerothrix sp.]|nr:response regulator [Thermanaerothrix sp.]
MFDERGASMVPYGAVIAEDDRSMVRLYRAFMEGVEGIRLIGVASSGDELLDFFQRGGRADLLILDIYLEGANGLAALRRIRALGAEVDAVVVSSEGAPKVVGEAMRLGIFDYLIKPFGASRFKRALEDFVAFRRRIDRLDQRLSQDDIDRLFPRGDSGEELPKGLHRATLKGILSCLSSNGEMTGEGLAEELGLSKSTVRRYLDYLVREGEVELKLKHIGRGRPVNLYVPVAKTDR